MRNIRVGRGSPSASAARDVDAPSASAARDVDLPCASAARDVDAPSASAARDVDSASAARDVDLPCASAARDVDLPCASAARDGPGDRSASAASDTASSTPCITVCVQDEEVAPPAAPAGDGDDAPPLSVSYFVNVSLKIEVVSLDV